MKTVKEVSRITGVSVRTLHYYDQIGLLKPSGISESGYRYYDESALARLQSILLFRELRFPLKEIRRILDTPGFDLQGALEQQIRLLELERGRLDGIIAAAREVQRKETKLMDFDKLDRRELDAYAREAREKWGHTDAYRAFEEKQAQGGAEEKAASLMALFARFGQLRETDPGSAAAQALCRELMDTITRDFYPCNPAILASLGPMYTADDRFRRNIDAAGGTGTADFAAKAIAIFCGK